MTSWENGRDSVLSNGGFRLKIGQLLRELWVFLWKKGHSQGSEIRGVRLLGGCVYYAEYDIFLDLYTV